MGAISKALFIPKWVVAGDSISFMEWRIIVHALYMLCKESEGHLNCRLAAADGMWFLLAHLCSRYF
jgi:hypothetical protein